MEWDRNGEHLAVIQDKTGVTTLYVTHDQAEAMTLADQIAVIDDGQIQQVGAPTNVYMNPRNMFVAGFLGSPSMNFLEGTLEESSTGKFELELGGDTHNVPDEFIDPLTPYLGDRVVLGIRPENIALNKDGVPANVHPATVNVVEPQGEKTILELSLDTGQNIKAAVDPDTVVERGDSVNLRFDRDSLQYFDPETGESLTHDLEPEQKVTA